MDRSGRAATSVFQEVTRALSCQGPAGQATARPPRALLDLGAVLTAPGCACTWTREILWEWGAAGLADTAELVASELVTNSVNACAGLDRAVIRLVLTLDRGPFHFLPWNQVPEGQYHTAVTGGPLYLGWTCDGPGRSSARPARSPGLRRTARGRRGGPPTASPASRSGTGPTPRPPRGSQVGRLASPAEGPPTPHNY
jgi:hypothetical protein